VASCVFSSILLKNNFKGLMMKTISKQWRLPDVLWGLMNPLLPPRKIPKKNPGGRPQLDFRMVADGIFYILRTGCQWKAVPPEFGSGSSLHRYFQKWSHAGIFYKMWHKGLLEYDELQGIDWSWQSIDSQMNKSPLGGKKTGPNPTDRSKLGSKRSILTDGDGIPLAVIAAGANVHDCKLFGETLESMSIRPPKMLLHLCADKGYDSDEIRLLSMCFGYEPHILSRGEEKKKIEKKGFRARRWVVERTNSWLNKFRRLYIRWEKKSENYESMIYLACAVIVMRAVG
jgi:putative transposase